MGEGATSKELLILSGKAFLFSLTGTVSDDRKKTLYSAAAMAAAKVRDLEEAAALEREFLTAVEQWKAVRVPRSLARLESSPTIEQWKTYIPDGVLFVELPMFISVAVRNAANVKAMWDQEKAAGLDVDEIVKKYDITASPVLDDEAKRRLEYETAVRIIEKAKDFLEANAHVNADYFQTISRKMSEPFVLADLILKYCDSDKTPKDVRLERLRCHAEMLDYFLRAVVYPNGQPLSLYQGSGRTSSRADLAKIYEQIPQLDPDAEIPGLPPEEDITILAATTSGGGCYVATAVYGSYDCPPVWTLRRYRDFTLAETVPGRAFIRLYYAVSPTLVKWFGHSAWFRALWKPVLDRKVARLRARGVEDTPYLDKY